MVGDERPAPLPGAEVCQRSPSIYPKDNEIVHKHNWGWVVQSHTLNPDDPGPETEVEVMVKCGWCGMIGFVTFAMKDIQWTQRKRIPNDKREWNTPEEEQ